MDIRGQGRVDRFKRAHADARASLKLWLSIVRAASWHKSADILADIPTASIVQGTHGKRAVFNIRHNDYRLDTKIDYERGIVLVKRIGTHREYDNWTFDS